MYSKGLPEKVCVTFLVQSMPTILLEIFFCYRIVTSVKEPPRNPANSLFLFRRLWLLEMVQTGFVVRNAG